MQAGTCHAVTALLQTHPGMYTEMGGAPGRHTLELFLGIIGHIAGIPGHHGVDMSDGSVMNSLSC